MKKLKVSRRIYRIPTPAWVRMIGDTGMGIFEATAALLFAHIDKEPSLLWWAIGCMVGGFIFKGVSNTLKAADDYQRFLEEQEAKEETSNVPQL